MVIGQTRGAPKIHRDPSSFSHHAVAPLQPKPNRAPTSRLQTSVSTLHDHLKPRAGCKPLATWIKMAMVSHKSGAKMDQISRLSFLELDHPSLEAQ